jgi:hypothetical protein
MALGKFLPRPKWEKMLRELGAEPDVTLPAISGAEWWRRPGQLPFTVPVEDGGESEFWAIQKTLEAQGGRQKFSRPLFRG